MCYLNISPWKLQDLDADDRTESNKSEYARRRWFLSSWWVWKRMRGLLRLKAPVGSTQAALLRMRNDPDVLNEAEDESVGTDTGRELEQVGGAGPPGGVCALNVTINGHRPNAETARLLAEAGGPEAIRKFTDMFYRLSFQDPHIDAFIRDHADPHGERFADWVCERFGHGKPWSTKRSTRSVCRFMAHGREFDSASNRTTAHYAAWHSPKRSAEAFGRHFGLVDCRVWMRLHFWALRQTGIWERSPAFVAYYTKFIAHFVSVYEQNATVFTRESARWSADARNVQVWLLASCVCARCPRTLGALVWMRCSGG